MGLLAFYFAWLLIGFLVWPPLLYAAPLLLLILFGRFGWRLFQFFRHA